MLCWEPKGDLGGNGPVLGRNVCGAMSPYHSTLTVLALHPCRSSLAVGQPWGAWWLCGCKTPVPSSVQAPCVGKGSLQPLAGGNFSCRWAHEEGPGPPGLAVGGCSAGAHPSWLLSTLCNSVGHPSPPSPHSFWSRGLYLSPTESGASGPTLSSSGINCLKHFFWIFEVGFIH